MIKFISHRGNIDKIVKDEENKPEKILHCIRNNYDVEIDVWFVENNYFLGHDKPEFKIERDFLLFNYKYLWCHAKNLNALEKMLSLGLLNCFWHQKDDFTITSKGYIWTYPDKLLTSNSVAVLPETSNYSFENLKNVFAICSDNIQFYKEKINEII